MNTSLQAISADSPPIKLADWLELAAVLDADGNASRQELATELRLNGTIEAHGVLDVTSHFEDTDVDQEQIADIEEEVDHHGDLAESIADGAFLELERRSKYAAEGYPFWIEDSSIELKTDVDLALSSYVFLLLLSWCGPKHELALNHYPERAFEDLCARAIASYLGGSASARSYKFGWPRSGPHRSFPEALTNIITELREGGEAKQRTETRKPKDDQLDIVAWIPFDDKLPGQLIAFGQCAAGSNWESKLSELNDTASWCSYRMTDPPLVPPVRTFFVPHCIEHGRWDWTVNRAGIMFERCRIASCSQTLDGPELQPARDWTQSILRTQGR